MACTLFSPNEADRVRSTCRSEPLFASDVFRGGALRHTSCHGTARAHRRHGRPAPGVGRARGSHHLSRQADGRVVDRPRSARVPRRLADATANARGSPPSRSSRSRARAPARTSMRPSLTNSMLFARDRQLCAYCGKRFLVRDLSRDHVVPVSRGGRDSWTNTVTACRSCNTRKGGRSPEQARHAAALRAVRAEPPRAFHPAQPAHPRRPDGVPARRRAAHEPPASRSRKRRTALACCSPDASISAWARAPRAPISPGDRPMLTRRGFVSICAAALVLAARCAARARAEQDQGGGRLHGAGRAAVGEPHPQGAQRRQGPRRDRVRVLREGRQRRLRARDARVRREGQHVHRRRVVRGRGRGAQGRQGLSRRCRS